MRQFIGYTFEDLVAQVKYRENGFAEAARVPRDLIDPQQNMPLYDTVIIPAAGRIPQRMEFFQHPLGAYDSNALIKTKGETNMVLANRLPDPQQFQVASLRVGIPLGILDSAVKNWLTRAWVELQVGQKLYAEFPLWVALLPPAEQAAALGDVEEIESHLDASIPVEILRAQYFGARVCYAEDVVFVPPARGPLRFTMVIEGLLWRTVC